MLAAGGGSGSCDGWRTGSDVQACYYRNGWHETVYKPRQKVVVKPNIGWDKVPELAGNTNPKLVAEIVKQCLAAGAKEVTVFDHTCDDWQKCYKNSGIEEAAKTAGAKVMPAHLESYYKPVSLPKGVRMKSAKVHELFLNSDVWINVPILKTWRRQSDDFHEEPHGGLSGIAVSSIPTTCSNVLPISATMDKAVLNVVDAYRVLKTNGPRGRSASDVVLTKGLFISQDIGPQIRLPPNSLTGSRNAA